MKLPVQLALLGTAGLLATSAFADTTILPVTSTPKNSVYISGDVGYGVLSTPNQNIAEPDGFYVQSASHSNGGFAGGVNIGINHALSSNLLVGGEFGWASNGRAKYTETSTTNDTPSSDETATLKITSTDLQLLATSTYVFNNGLNVFGKAGAARVQQKGTVSSSPAWEAETTETRYQPMLAAGIGYQFRMVNLFVQYGHIFGKDAKNFNDLFNVNVDEDGNPTGDASFNGTVAVDTIKAGVAVNFAL
jgi:opacity protein-like surface antigen